MGPPGVDTFLLTQETTTEGIIAHALRTQPRTIQLVDAVPLSTYEQLRTALPGIKLVQVIHVIDQKAIEEAQAIGPLVDAILLDSGNPHLAVKELGGTGRTHNWAISAALCKAVDTPVFLAGGLQPGNIREAIETVRPFGVDLCSGVRTMAIWTRKNSVYFLKKFMPSLPTQMHNCEKPVPTKPVEAAWRGQSQPQPSSSPPILNTLCSTIPKN